MTDLFPFDLWEAVPNVSEGRNREVVEGIESAIHGVAGAHLLDRHVDPDHNRTVFTLVARDGDDLLAALLAMFHEASKKIDLRGHSGAHPRTGAVDVVPLVRLGGHSEEEGRELARTLGSELARLHDLPVFLYEHSASANHRRTLPSIRRGGLDGLAARMREAGWKPDFGPEKHHESLGSVITGLRDVLVAFNVLLDSTEPGPAALIARKIRESSGGLPGVRALGMSLLRRGKSQVSINLVRPFETTVADAFEAVSSEAHALGVDVLSSEIVGLAPARSLGTNDLASLLLEREDIILEDRVRKHGIGFEE